MIVKTNLARPSLFAVLALATCFLMPAAQASTVAVGTCPTTYITFSAIQTAINAVPAGSTIKICPGNYYEQLVITKKLTLEGVATTSQDAVVIYSPAAGLVQNTSDPRGAVAAHVLVQGASLVSISNLTVDSTGNNYNGDDLRGILYQDASGTVNHVAVRNVVPNDTPTGDQSGQGIMVETTTSPSASLTVENSSVHNYNKNGIVARYSGAALTATGNYVQGNGPISYIAQNGIEIAFNGATGSIKNNTVIDNFYIPTTDSASDILLYDSSGAITVSGNITGNSNIAIALEAATSGYGNDVSVTGNKIFGTSTFDGIDVCTNNNTVTGNVIFNSAQSAVHLDATCAGGTGNSNTVSGNTILESACAGYLADSGTTGNAPLTGTFYTVPFPTTSSTGECTIPSGPARAGATHKFQP
ncbi:MAG: right-handed parallel beta-helix repeat-containing protein [Terriglobales bacterium]